jgi:diadenosine tetraphosphate (Ap4A) HIT family hydrolase
MSCPFCNAREPADTPLSSHNSFAIRDKFPVTNGHMLVIPRRHVTSIFGLHPDEQSDIWTLVARVRAHIAQELGTDGFNIGINDGQAAGQTVPHAHVHVIPRYAGDVPDPRGGIRWIIPDNAPYWNR